LPLSIQAITRRGLTDCDVQTFALNLSAPFIPQFFQVQLQSVLPHVDILICNETEAETWASATGLPASSLPDIARALAVLPKSNASRPRLVVITHGKEDTIVVSSAKPDAPETYPVHALREADIVDTNAAGDAFAGGFMAALVDGRDIPAAVKAGQKLAAICVQEVRATSAPVVSSRQLITPIFAGRPSVQVAEGNHPGVDDGRSRKACSTLVCLRFI
jgi:sugar/nucleoside kinase (ribokinase family)